MKDLQNNSFIKTEGLLWEGVLKSVKKSQNRLQPLFEAITNSIESISLLHSKYESENVNQDIISIDFHYDRVRNIFGEEDVFFNKLIITDSGIGFDDANFERAFVYKDTRKGFNNRGSGRIQFLHFFQKCYVDSIFSNGEDFLRRRFSLSKSPNYLKENAIIFYNQTEKVKKAQRTTTVTLESLADEKDIAFYNEIDMSELKNIILFRYMMYFCSHRNNLPMFFIKKYISNQLIDSIDITISDIPEYDKESTISVFYSIMSNDMKRVEKTSQKEDFIIKAFKINKNQLKNNEIKLTSKGEVLDSVRFKFDNLKPEDEIEDNRYLFLVSSDYIDRLDGDCRGEDLPLLNKTDFKKKYKDIGYSEEEILFDEIEEGVNDKISAMYSEIGKKAEEKKQEVEKLKSMFLLNNETVNSLRISINDTEEKILEKVYAADAKIIAEGDARIKQHIDSLEELNPTSDDYTDQFYSLVAELTKDIPLQNRTALTHYIARRKLVLELFDKILQKKIRLNGAAIDTVDEKLLHNLLFQQGSDNPEDSDLWIINEDFIYFKGTSEKQLSKIKIDGNLLFKNIFSIEEERYLVSLGENRKIKRPDVLLFPDEGKCIIIEFKAPDVNVAEHLTQIDFYANLIRNYTQDEFQITTFYGYLIGENIEPRDVLGRVSRYEHSYQFDYLFRPSENVVGFDGRTNGSIYTEVIKYSTLLERALKRNSFFLNKLGLLKT